MMLCGQRPVWQPVLIALLLTAWAYASGPSVSVTLDGPSEGWHSEDLTFTAGGDYSMDGATQQEVQDGEAGVSEAYAWSYAPAQLIAGGGTLWLVFVKSFTQREATALCIMRSSDAGKTWTEPQQITSGRWVDRDPCIIIHEGHPVVAFSRCRAPQKETSIWLWEGKRGGF